MASLREVWLQASAPEAKRAKMAKTDFFMEKQDGVSIRSIG
jgi:hypothetical protein